MKPITFKQFLKAFNFRRCYNSGNETIYDSRIIRIHYKNSLEDDWFEFGAYEFGQDDAVIVAERIFNKNIINRYVNTISIDDESNLHIYLSKKECLSEEDWDLT